MDFQIKDARPIWQQLSEQLKKRIVTGYYAPGSRFPSVRDLAAEAGVNPNTMQRALTQLESEGLLITNRTVGRTVTTEEETLTAIRRELAREETREYLEAMGHLGYSRQQCAEIISEGEKE